MKCVGVKIEGLPPGLLMHRFPIEDVPAFDKLTKEEQAEISAYRLDGEGGELYLPGVALSRSLVAGATYVKGKGRASMQKPTAACVFIDPAYIGLGVKEYEISSMPVRNPATRGTVVRHRPWLKKWAASFELIYDPTLISAEKMREIVDNAGRLAGVLDFRPACKGPYGRFVVVKWEPQVVGESQKEVSND